MYGQPLIGAVSTQDTLELELNICLPSLAFIMDPLSMTASIIAVVGAGGTIGKGLAKIVALRHAPQIVLALNIEIADLQCVVQDIDDLLRRFSEMTDFLPPTSLWRALRKSRKTLAELESLVSYELTSIKGKRNQAELDRSVWLRAEHKAQRLKGEIRDDSVRLASNLSLLASYVCFSISLATQIC